MSTELDPRTVVERVVFSQLLSPNPSLCPLYKRNKEDIKVGRPISMSIGTTDGWHSLSRHAGLLGRGLYYDILDFKMDVPSPKMWIPGVDIDLFETCHDGTLRSFFQCASGLESVRLFQSQLLEIAGKEETREKLPLESGSFALFTKGDEPVNQNADNAYVCRMFRDSKGIYGSIRSLSDRHVYRECYRNVVLIPRPPLVYL